MATTPGRFEAETRKAVAEASQFYEEHQKDGERRRSRGGLDNLTELLKLVLAVAAIGLVLLVIDGMRREYGEYYANLATFQPQVAVRRVKSSLPVAKQLQLQHKDAVSTAANGTATIAFPDGSAVLVEPRSKFEVQLLDYNRGPKRDRSFLLRSGSVFTRISHLFGKRGQTLICTPNAVAAARGTGYRTSYDPGTNTTFVEVIDGKVALRNAGGRIEIPKGQTGTAVGNHPPTLGTLGRTQALANRFQNLARLDPPEPPIVAFERQALTLCNPVFQMIALTPHGFAPGDNDWARRAATKRELQVLQQAFEAVNGDVPETLNPITLSEINLNADEREKLLDSLAGRTIDRYEKRGQNSYRVVARSRDSAGTTFEMTETGVRAVD